MIDKVVTYCKADGILNTIKFIVNTIQAKIYRKSVTYFYQSNAKPIDSEPLRSDIIIKTVGVEDIDSVDFPRLKDLPCKKWLNQGSKLFVAYKGEKPVAYTWTHYHNYEIHGVGFFVMNNGECWIGPTFVLNKYRGQGLNKIQIRHQMELDTSTIFYTSVNHKNTPSCKSFERLGFSSVGQVNTITKMGHHQNLVSGNSSFMKKLEAL